MNKLIRYLIIAGFVLITTQAHANAEEVHFRLKGEAATKCGLVENGEELMLTTEDGTVGKFVGYASSGAKITVWGELVPGDKYHTLYIVNVRAELSGETCETRNLRMKVRAYPMGDSGV